jgi:hypothetical protein
MLFLFVTDSKSAPKKIYPELFGGCLSLSIFDAMNNTHTHMKNQLPIYQSELSHHYLFNFSCLGFYPTEEQFSSVMSMIEQGQSPDEIATYLSNQNHSRKESMESIESTIQLLNNLGMMDNLSSKDKELVLLYLKDIASSAYKEGLKFA